MVEVVCGCPQCGEVEGDDRDSACGQTGICSEQTVESIHQSLLVPAIRLETPYKI